MNDVSDFLFPWMAGWRLVDAVTVNEAACLLTGVDPAPYRQSNWVLPSEAEAMATAIEQAILLKRISPFVALVYDEGCAREIPIFHDDLDPFVRLQRSTTVQVEELAKWCDEKGVTHPWGAHSASQSKSTVVATYPAELRAAIEAFEAVNGDPTKTAKRTPKAALAAWLEANKPKLSSNARERIATVANWQPAGGAPKTPGG